MNVDVVDLTEDGDDISDSPRRTRYDDEVIGAELSADIVDLYHEDDSEAEEEDQNRFKAEADRLFQPFNVFRKPAPPAPKQNKPKKKREQPLKANKVSTKTRKRTITEAFVSTNVADNPNETKTLKQLSSLRGKSKPKSTHKSTEQPTRQEIVPPSSQREKSRESQRDEHTSPPVRSAEIEGGSIINARNSNNYQREEGASQPRNKKGSFQVPPQNDHRGRIAPPQGPRGSHPQQQRPNNKRVPLDPRKNSPQQQQQQHEEISNNPPSYQQQRPSRRVALDPRKNNPRQQHPPHEALSGNPPSYHQQRPNNRVALDPRKNNPHQQQHQQQHEEFSNNQRNPFDRRNNNHNRPYYADSSLRHDPRTNQRDRRYNNDQRPHSPERIPQHEPRMKQRNAPDSRKNSQQQRHRQPAHTREYGERRMAGDPSSSPSSLKKDQERSNWATSRDEAKVHRKAGKRHGERNDEDKGFDFPRKNFPKTLLHSHYARSLSCSLRTSQYLTWDASISRQEQTSAHHGSYRYSCIVIDPRNGECFWSAPFNNVRSERNQYGTYLFASKKLAEQGAAATAYDCLLYRQSKQPGAPKFGGSLQLGKLPPYQCPQVFIPTPDIPSNVVARILQTIQDIHDKKSPTGCNNNGSAQQPTSKIVPEIRSFGEKEHPRNSSSPDEETKPIISSQPAPTLEETEQEAPLNVDKKISHNSSCQDEEAKPISSQPAPTPEETEQEAPFDVDKKIPHNSSCQDEETNPISSRPASTQDEETRKEATVAVGGKEKAQNVTKASFYGQQSIKQTQTIVPPTLTSESKSDDQEIDTKDSTGFHETARPVQPLSSLGEKSRRVVSVDDEIGTAEDGSETMFGDKKPQIRTDGPSTFAKRAHNSTQETKTFGRPCQAKRQDSDNNDALLEKTPWSQQKSAHEKKPKSVARTSTVETQPSSKTTQDSLPGASVKLKEEEKISALPIEHHQQENKKQSTTKTQQSSETKEMLQTEQQQTTKKSHCVSCEITDEEKDSLPSTAPSSIKKPKPDEKKPGSAGLKKESTCAEKQRTSTKRPRTERDFASSSAPDSKQFEGRSKQGIKEENKYNFIIINDDTSEDDEPVLVEPKQKRRKAAPARAKSATQRKQPASRNHKPSSDTNYYARQQKCPERRPAFSSKKDFTYMMSGEAAAAMQEKLLREAAEKMRKQAPLFRMANIATIPTFNHPFADVDTQYPGHWQWKDPFDRLGLPKHASISMVKTQYRRLARKYHPDKNLNNPRASEKFERIASAYSTIMDRLQP